MLSAGINPEKLVKLIITYAGKYRELKLAGKVVFCRSLIISVIKNLLGCLANCLSVMRGFIKFGL